MKNEEIVKLLREKGLPKYTDNSITDINAFMEEVEKTRRLGYGVDFEEYLRGVRAVSGPIYQDDRMVGAIWIVGFSNTMTDDKLSIVIDHLNETIKRINRRISFIPQIDDEEI